MGKEKWSLAARILSALLAALAWTLAYNVPACAQTAALAMGDRPNPAATAAASAASAAASATKSQRAAEAAAGSANFAAEGGAKNASSASSSASAARSSERRAEAAAVRAEKAAKKLARSTKASAARAAPPGTLSQAQQQRSEAEASAVEPGVSGGFRWVHFGVAPYASSREAAMRTRESAFRTLGFPEAVVAQLMVATQKAGEKTRINVGDHLNGMLSKGGALHKDVTVAFDSPVRGMEYAAPAEMWTVTWEGRQYTVKLPEVCGNWSSVIGPAPVAAVPPVGATPSRGPSVPIAASPECPDGWTLVLNAWDIDTLPFLMRMEAQSLIRAAEARESDHARLLVPYTPDAVSRTMGKRLREQVKVRAPVAADIQVRFLNPVTAKVEQNLGTARMVNGMVTFRFVDDPREYVVETLWPESFESPVKSGGVNRIRLFGKYGNWKNEWIGICEMNEHGLVHFAKP